MVQHGRPRRAPAAPPPPLPHLRPPPVVQRGRPWLLTCVVYFTTMLLRAKTLIVSLRIGTSSQYGGFAPQACTRHKCLFNKTERSPTSLPHTTDAKRGNSTLFKTRDDPITISLVHKYSSIIEALFQCLPISL